MIALLAVDRLVDVAQLRERLGRKQVVHRPWFPAGRARPAVLLQEAWRRRPMPQPDRIDIPGGELHVSEISPMLFERMIIALRIAQIIVLLSCITNTYINCTV